MNSDGGECSTPAKKAKIAPPDHQKVAGQIASVHVQNFMCHKNLLIEFDVDNNNCFYIGGPNGSGKSALFAAMSIGLGAQAANNDRGNNVGTFIKDGETTARITIVLTNEGINAIQNCGNRISVKRTVNRSSSRYKITSLASTGNKVIGVNKKSLTVLLEKLNIRVDNPVLWMTQEKCKEFLANYNPSSMYRMFMESTSLSSIWNSISGIDKSIETCTEVVEEKKQELKRETEKLKKMLEQRQLQEKLEKDIEVINVMEWKLLFCPIRDLETEIQINEKKQQVHKKLVMENKIKFSENRTKRAEFEKEFQTWSDEIELTTEDIEECEKDLLQFEKEKMEFSEKIRIEKNLVKRAENEIEQLRGHIKNAQKNAEEYHKKNGTEQMKAKLSRDEKCLEKLIVVIEKLEGKEGLSELTERLKHLNADLQTKQDDWNVKNLEFERLKNELQAHEGRIERIQATRISSINKYGPYMARLCKEIEKVKDQFDHIPKGPIGKYMKLVDPRWEYAIEVALGKLADNFLCSSQKDAILLRNIYDKMNLGNKWPSLHVVEFTGKAYTNLHQPSREFKTVYQMLEFSDMDVHNAVIDASKCEQMVLFEKNGDAMRIMGASHPPANIHRGYTLDGSIVHPNGEKKQYRFYATQSAHIAKLFSNLEVKDNDGSLAEINDFKCRVESASKEVKEKKLAMDQAKGRMYRARQQQDGMEKRLFSLKHQKLQTERAIQDAKMELTQTEEGDFIENLKFSVEAVEDRISRTEEERQAHLAKIPILEAEFQKRVKDERSVKKELEKSKGIIKNYKGKLEERRMLFDDLDEKATAFQKIIDGLRGEDLKLFNEESRLKCERDDAVKAVDAKKLAVTMPPGEKDPADLTNFPTTEVATRELEALKRTRDDNNQRCDKTITAQAIAQFRADWKQKNNTCIQLGNKMESMKQVKRNRLHSYPELLMYTEIKVSQKFQELLAIRGNLNGRLQFNHEAGTLSVIVHSCIERDPRMTTEPENDTLDQKRKKNGAPFEKKIKMEVQRNDLKGLSGGERSFITTALLMSLWEVIGQPFRMMDEFDVYMDMINRKLVMDLLVETATKEFPNNQFIFFTPQGIKELKMVDGLQVLELPKIRD